MSTVTPVIENQTSLDATTRKITWTLTTADSEGAWVKFAEFRDRCVTITGTFGAGTVLMKGSNDNGTNSFTLTDPQGNAISTGVAAMEQVLESPEKVRPVITGSTAATVVVTLFIARNK